MYKVGDILICKEDFYIRSKGNKDYITTFSKLCEYIILRRYHDGKFWIGQPRIKGEYFDALGILQNFYTIKELRKIKLTKLNNEKV